MEEALIKRILPHSIEAEQSVIGSMILDRDAILVASEILTSDDFYQKQYGIIFDAMVELCNEGKPVDLVTLQNRLKEKELPPDISSMEYVRDLISAVPTSANVKYYAKIVSEKAVLRRLIKANEEIANTCYLEKENTEIILEEAEKKLFNILQRRNNEEYVPTGAGGPCAPCPAFAAGYAPPPDAWPQASGPPPERHGWCIPPAPRRSPAWPAPR